MAKNPFHQLAVMKKVTQTDRKVIDCYRLMYKKALWDEAAKRIVLQNQLKQGCISEIMIEQLIQALRTNTLHVKTMNQNTRIMNELVQQVILLILRSVFQEVHDVLIQFKTRHDVIQSIRNHQGKIHTLVTGSFSKDIQHSIHPLLHEKITDKRFIHLIKNFVTLLDKQPDEYFLSNDLLRFVHEVSSQSLDNWMKKHDQDIYYHRYEEYFFMAFKHEDLNVKQFTQKIKQFTREEKLSLETLQARSAKKGVNFLGYKLHQGPAEIRIQCAIPKQSIQQFIQEHDYGLWQTFTPTSRPYLLHLPEGKIIQVYNRELCVFASHYKLATNFHRLRPVLFLARKSLLQTIARKRNSTPKKIKKRLERQVASQRKFITYPYLQKLSKRIN